MGSLEAQLQELAQSLEECNDGLLDEVMEQARKRQSHPLYTPPRATTTTTPLRSTAGASPPPPAPVQTPVEVPRPTRERSPGILRNNVHYPPSSLDQARRLDSYSKQDVSFESANEAIYRRYHYRNDDSHHDYPSEESREEQTCAQGERRPSSSSFRSSSAPKNRPASEGPPLKQRAWQELVDSMHDIIDRQEKLIDQLRLENEHLRGQLQRVESTPSRHNNTQFSPGTRFVAELSQVMELDPGYDAALATILDKHWSRVVDIKRRHQWS
jgi:hypothetical protein